MGSKYKSKQRASNRILRRDKMQNYIYENLWTQNLEDAIEASTTKPLIVEMFYKYGLKVYDMSDQQIYSKRTKEISTVTNFYMTVDGSPTCSVASRELKDFNGDTKIEYICFSPNYNKERAVDEYDRHTVSSVRLSNLIKTIDKNKLTGHDTVDLFKISGLMDNFRGMWQREMGNLRTKELDKLDHKHLETMIAYMAGEVDRKDINEETISYSKVCLDKCKAVDENNNRITGELDNIFYNPFYMLGVDKGSGLMIGKVRCAIPTKADKTFYGINVEEVEPFKRVASIDDYEDKDKLLPVLTMFKIINEQNSSPCKHGVPTQRDAVNMDLNIATYYRGRDSYFDGAWLLIPNIE